MAKRKPTGPRKKPRQERARVTVESIVTAAERVVSREGAQRTTTNRIAEVAGVSIGSLYQYFPNKDSLIETLRSREGERFEGGLDRALTELFALPLPDAVRRLVDLFISLHTEGLALHNALAGDGPDLAQFHERWIPLVLAYLEPRREELRPTDLRLAARICLEALEALTHSVALRSPELFSNPAYAEELTALLVRYLER